MIYFLVGFLTSYIIFGILKRQRERFKLRKIAFRQSTLHQIVKNVMPTNAEYKKQLKTQARDRLRNKVVKVIQTPDRKAYWVDGNIFYCADVINGEFDPSAGIPVDTSNLSKKEIDKLLFILDNLNSQNG